MASDNFSPRFSPSSGIVVGVDPKTVLAASTTIPCDSVLGLGDFHPNRAVDGVVSAMIVDEFFCEDKYGPIRQAFPVADILAGLRRVVDFNAFECLLGDLDAQSVQPLQCDVRAH